MRFICTNCGYIYDEEKGDTGSGITPGTLFANLPENWICPICYVGKEAFDPVD